MRKYPSVPQPSAACGERLVRPVRPVPSPAGSESDRRSPQRPRKGGTPLSAMVHRIPVKPIGIEDETKSLKLKLKPKCRKANKLNDCVKCQDIKSK